MVGLKISSEEIKEIIPILGLTDDDQGKVYLSLLSLGTATLGQISLLSGLDYIKTQNALQILVGSKLVKRVPGKVGRYIALEPFLKAFFLTYDPITLVNIRKESSNAFQVQVKQIDDIFAETAENFQKDNKKLEDSFSQGFTPIKLNFNNFMGNFRQVIESSENKIRMNIEEIKTKTQMVVEQSEKLNEEIINVNLGKLKEIPRVFDPCIHEVTQELKTISQVRNNNMERLKSDYRTDFESLKNNIREEITDHSKKTDEVLNQFESDRSEEQKNFEEKIERTISSLENLRLNAIQKKGNFLEIRQGYKEIDKMVRDLFLELENKLNNMEPLITSSIEDIQSRKLFKGKDVFISNLTRVDGHREAIQQFLKEQLLTLEKIKSLNDTMNETEDEIVQATETGLQKVRRILNEEVQILSHDLQDIKIKISSEFRTSIQNYLDTKKQDMKTKIVDIETVFDKKIDIFNQQLNETITKLLDKVSSLVQHSTDEFVTNLESYLEKKTASDSKKISFDSVLDKIDKIRLNSNSELKSVFNQVSDLENTFSIYFSEMNAFLTSFADTQLGKYNSTLNKTKEILNTQTFKIKQQLEREISALTFSIKEMKQKLNKIFDLSRSVEISERESSLITSDLVVGEPAIIMTLRDLTLRAKASLTVLMPRPELQTLKIASKLPMKTRVSIIGDFRKVPESTLKKILSSANLRLKQLDGVDFWGCIRDAEELLVCPEPKKVEREELIGVITTNENLVELFSQEIMTYTTRSREIVL
ncbi:MAG: helix-turn-helix domain-containing protein [Candidatus Hodarchaeales archaeon]|jgi:sugar-specific transcriptional regulator TrmB